MGEQVNSGCWVRLSDGSVVELEKDPSLRDETVDTDKDGIPDIFELNDIYTIRVYNPYTQSIQKIDTWSYFSNPAKVDTDGDGLIDIEDIRPNVYDVIPVEETDSYIVFNTGRTWYNISCTAYDYLDNLFQFADGHVDNAIPIEEYRGIAQNVLNNSNQSFGIEELIYISFRNPNGAPLYMHDETEAVRETVFQSVSGRESRYYQHTGTLWEENWSEVPKGTESGFFKGTVLSEADISYSWKLYTVCDVYSVLTTLSKIGALVMVVLLVVEVTPVVVANVSALTNYIKLYGVTEGIKVYLKIGVSGLPDGLMSALQMEVSDGGGTPGGGEVPGEEELKADIDKYLEKIVDASGSINTEKMDDIRLAI